MAQELIITVSGGAGGGAVIRLTLDGREVFRSTATDQTNQTYDNTSGRFGTETGEIAITVMPPSTTSSPLTLILAGAVTDSLAVMPVGASTADGYNYAKSIIVGGEEPLPPGFIDTGMGWGALGAWLTESGSTKLGSLGAYRWPTGDYQLPVPRTGSSGADIKANGVCVHTYTSFVGSYHMEVWVGASADGVFAFCDGTGRNPLWLNAVAPNDTTTIYVCQYNTDTGDITGVGATAITTYVGVVGGVTWYRAGSGFISIRNGGDRVFLCPTMSALEVCQTVVVAATDVYKLNPGWAVTAFIHWRDTVKTYFTPILISTDEAATKISLDGTTEYYNTLTTIQRLDGMSFFVTVINSDEGNLTESLVNTAEFADTIYTISGVFRRIAGSSYSDIRILTSPDPYEDQTGSSEPGGGDGGNIEDDEIDFTPPGASSVVSSGFVTLFVPSQYQLNQLASYMWSSAFDIDSVRKLFANPMDCILGLSVFPFRIGMSGTKEVKVGSVGTGIQMDYTLTQYWPVDCGIVTVPEQWGAYMDYSPYTKINIYLPYIGFRPISADDVMGKTLHLRYLVDIFSGACTAELKCGSSVLYSWSGNCAQQIPITGQSWQGAYTAALSIAAGVVSLASGGATAPMAAGAIASATVNSMSLKPEVQRGGSISGAAGFTAGQKPYLVRTNPRSAIPSGQNKYHGYPSFVTVNLGSISGYNEIYSIHLEGIPATSEELSEIETILKGGAIF